MCGGGAGGGGGGGVGREAEGKNEITVKGDRKVSELSKSP